MWAGFFAVGKAVFGIFSADPGHSIAMAFMIFIGSVVMLAIPAYVIGWLTGGSDGQGDAAHGIPAPIVTRDSAIGKSTKPSRAAEIPSSQSTTALPDDSRFFGLVAKELTLNQRDEGLWTMAFALENGDEAKTKAHYIRLRVKQLKAQPAQLAEGALAPISTVTTESQSLVGDAPDLKPTPSVKPSEFWLSQQAKRELETGRVDNEILAKAKAFAGGSEPQVAELYIRFRVNSLLDAKQ